MRFRSPRAAALLKQCPFQPPPEPTPERFRSPRAAALLKQIGLVVMDTLSRGFRSPRAAALLKLDSVIGKVRAAPEGFRSPRAAALLKPARDLDFLKNRQPFPQPTGCGLIEAKVSRATPPPRAAVSAAHGLRPY